jgi:hypothetical protein
MQWLKLKLEFMKIFGQGSDGNWTNCSGGNNNNTNVIKKSGKLQLCAKLVVVLFIWIGS